MIFKLKYASNALIIIGLLYLFIFGLDSNSNHAILHTLLSTTLMIIGLVSKLFYLYKK